MAALLVVALISPDFSPAGKKHDCAASSNTLCRQAEILSARTRQLIPREVARVSVDRDDFCDERDFAEAQISAAWMSTCLGNFTKNSSRDFAPATSVSFAPLSRNPARARCGAA
jgi:hypothetical protein